LREVRCGSPEGEQIARNKAGLRESISSGKVGRKIKQKER
jgi:hypothetical protein